MIKRFCNKCGKEISDFQTFYAVNIAICKEAMPEEELMRLDICDKCFDDMYRQMKEKNKTSEKGNISEENNDN